PNHLSQNLEIRPITSNRVVRYLNPAANFDPLTGPDQCLPDVGTKPTQQQNLQPAPGISLSPTEAGGDDPAVIKYQNVTRPQIINYFEKPVMF
ncbi:unnamed protein product, partial [marine sediment metagenome]